MQKIQSWHWGHITTKWIGCVDVNRQLVKKSAIADGGGAIKNASSS
jgi:hypothetical protein